MLSAFSVVKFFLCLSVLQMNMWILETEVLCLDVRNPLTHLSWMYDSSNQYLLI